MAKSKSPSKCESTIKIMNKNTLNTIYTSLKRHKWALIGGFEIYAPFFFSILNNFGSNKILKGEVFCHGDLVEQKLIWN